MRPPSLDWSGASLAPATGRRIAYAIPDSRSLFVEAELSSRSPVPESYDIATPERVGGLLAVLIDSDFEAEEEVRYPIRKTEISIGRGEDNDLILDHPSVAHHHARLALAGGVWALQDLASVGGSMVDGREARRKTPVAPGSELAIGEVALVFQAYDSWEDSPAQLKAPSSVLTVSGDEEQARPADESGSNLAFNFPQKQGGIPVPVVVGFVITVVTILGYLMSRGG